MATATRLTPFSRINQMGPSMPNGSDLDKVVSAIDSIQGQSGTTAYNGKFNALTVTGTSSFTGAITAAGGISAAGGFNLPVQAMTTSTTGTLINPYGVVTLATTQAGLTYNITGSPSVGAELNFFCTVATSQLITSSSTAITIQSTTGLTQKIAAFTLAGQALQLRAISTTAWAVVANTGGVTFT